MKRKETATSWMEAIYRLRPRVYDVEVYLPKDLEPGLPPGISLIRSPFPYSVAKGAHQVYREDVKRNHLQIREYRDQWSVELDRFNPHYYPIPHAVHDAPLYTGMAVAGLAVALSGRMQ